jgi:hypothetical protein
MLMSSSSSPVRGGDAHARATTVGAHCRSRQGKVKPRAAWLAVLAIAACQAAGPPASPGITRDEAARVLTVQAGKWNAGDLEGFVATYWDGPELTFLGASGLTRGRADLLAQYRRGYPDAEARGVLTFDVLDFRPLGSDHALLLGRYHIQRSKPAEGWFSLVMARQDGRLVILHDHSSAAAPAK